MLVVKVGNYIKLVLHNKISLMIEHVIECNSFNLIYTIMILQNKKIVKALKTIILKVDTNICTATENAILKV